MKCRAIDFRVAGVSVSDLRRYVISNLASGGFAVLAPTRRICMSISASVRQRGL